nr:MmgE/PrpD family protein [Aestuariicella hydrocarbonica]
MDHVVSVTYTDLSAAAVESCKTFVLDSLGVGLSGSRVPFVDSLIKVARVQWSGPGSAHVWNSGVGLGPSSAALVNAYQIHNQEFDCVHEPAVVHPMAVILSTLLAWSEQLAVRGRPVDGQALISALSVAVDVATVIGMCASQPMRFFRPGICGGLGAVAGMARLSGFDRALTQHALGIFYSQMGGTMQAHLEGSETLPMQIAFNARNAVVAIELAQAGLTAPQNILDGEFGLFSLFEDAGNADEAFAQLGRIEQITRVSHKPYPTGRAAHGGLDGIAQLRDAMGFAVEDIDSIVISAPPLIRRLVDRPATASMNHNYAKLCMGYIAATFLLTGDMTVADYQEQALRDPRRLALADKIHMQANTINDPNALAPQSVEVHLTDGRCQRVELPAVLGSPARSLSREQHLKKFRQCCRSGAQPLSTTAIERLIDSVDQLQACADVRALIALTRAGSVSD